MPVTRLQPQKIAEGFGQSDLRLAYFDCATSWPHPTGGGAAGWVVLPRDAPAWNVRWLRTARLRYEQKVLGLRCHFASVKTMEEQLALKEAACTLRPRCWS
jgi:hypothetical protein